MAQYGYKISELSRAEKFAEAECFLDRKLKGYEKQMSGFEADGSVTIRYTKKADDGSVSEISLVKNITESAIMVFSDKELKYFKRGGWILYLRDLIPTVLFSCVIWYLFIAVYFVGNGFYDLLQKFVLMLVAIVAADLITGRFLSKNRSRERIAFIQSGGIFTVLLSLYYVIDCARVGISIKTFLMLVCFHIPTVAIYLGAYITGFIRKLAGRS